MKNMSDRPGVHGLRLPVVMIMETRRARITLAGAAVVILVTAAPAAAASAAGPEGRARNAVTPQSARAGIISTIGGGPGGPGAGRTIAVAGPCGVTSDGRNLYFTEWSGDRVRRLDQGSDALSTVVAAGTTGLNNPRAMTTDAAGNVVYADTGSSVLRVIAARNGMFYGRSMRAGHSYVIGGSSFSGPDAVRADRYGNLLVSSQTTYESDYGPEPGTAVVFVLAGRRGTFYGQSMVPGHVYPLAGQQCPGAPPYGCPAGLAGDGGPALAATFGPQLWRDHRPVRERGDLRQRQRPDPGGSGAVRNLLRDQDDRPGHLHDRRGRHRRPG